MSYRIRFRVDFFKRTEVCHVIDIISLSINPANLVYFHFSEINKAILETQHFYEKMLFKEAMRTGFYEFQVRGYFVYI